MRLYRTYARIRSNSPASGAYGHFGMFTHKALNCSWSDFLPGASGGGEKRRHLTPNTPNGAIRSHARGIGGMLDL